MDAEPAMNLSTNTVNNLWKTGWRVDTHADSLVATRPGLRLTLRYREGRGRGAWRARLSDGMLRFTIAKNYGDDLDSALSPVLADAAEAAQRMDGEVGLVPNAGKGFLAYRRWLATGL
ncbi:MAG: hypothetical protein ACI81R_001649 [Bradymonadia bacterium]|jgi:hypothetical protein